LGSAVAARIRACAYAAGAVAHDHLYASELPFSERPIRDRVYLMTAPLKFGTGGLRNAFFDHDSIVGEDPKARCLYRGLGIQAEVERVADHLGDRLRNARPSNAADPYQWLAI
jgi:hypothetical protein